MSKVKARNVKVTLNRGGSAETTVPLAQLNVPDAWHAAMQLKKLGFESHCETVLETWHLAHSLLKELQERLL